MKAGTQHEEMRYFLSQLQKQLLFEVHKSELNAKKLVSDANDERVLLYNKTAEKTIKFDLIINSTPASFYGEMPQMPEIKLNELD